MSPGHGAAIWQGGQLVADTVREGHLFRLAIPTPQSMIVPGEEEDVDGYTDIKDEDLIVWHMKMGHLKGADVKKLEKMALGARI